MDRTPREYVATTEDVATLNQAVSEGDSLTMLPIAETDNTVTGVVFLGNGQTVLRTVDVDRSTAVETSTDAVDARDAGDQTTGAGSPVAPSEQGTTANVAVADNNTEGQTTP